MGQQHTENSETHTDSPPSTEKRLEYLSRMSQKLSSFLPSDHHGHGHGHHTPTHTQYKRPEVLTNQLALYSLRKLSRFQNFPIDVQDKRILQPVAPGVLSWGIFWGFIGARVGYASWTFLLGGYRAFLGTRFLATQVGLWALQKVVLFGVDNLREMNGNKEKNQVARKYRALIGDKVLLDALHPQFLLGKFAHPQNYYGHGHGHH